MILNKYKESANSNKVNISNDLQLILNILQRLFRDKVTEANDRILFPIHSENEQTLILKPLTQCTFCDAKWLQDMVDEEDENIYYVHSEVPQSIAEGLGVKSLRQHMMSDAEALEEWGQEEPLTRRLHSLLKEGYLDGLSVPKELIQNADDAGATEVCFILDERENLDCRTQLLDEGMSELQGPALLVYNNALFTNDDLQNITKLNGGTKETDTTKIGKFGLGFCAVYNITDVPSFLNGHDVVIFDPHKKYLGNALPGNSPGLRINLKSMRNMKMMKRLHRQFKPFHGVLGCDISASQINPFFNGTLFRLPLRTKEQAKTSEIKNTSYSKEEAVALLKQLINSLGNMLLFTQTVESINVLHIPASCTDPSKAITICSATKELHQTRTESVLQTCSYRKSNRLLKRQPFALLQVFDIKVDCKDTPDLGIGKNSSNLRWLVSWATGESESLVELCYSPMLKGALPLGSVALPVRADETQIIVHSSLEEVPFGFYKKGHLFCFLPLPVELPLPVHINGHFAVTSDRRGLRTNTEDDKAINDTNWNGVLLGDAVVLSFISLLEYLHDSENIQRELSSGYKFYQLWPKSSIPQNLIMFKKKFYQNIVTSNRPVFQSEGSWIGIRKCIFLEKTLAYHDTLGTAAILCIFKFYSNPDSYVIDMPCEYFDEIEKVKGWEDSCRVITVNEFFKDIFLPNLSNSYWFTTGSLEKRNALLLYCIECSNAELDSLLKSTACIPSSPNGKLIKPGDSVSPNGKVSKLFSLDDERFPDGSFRGTVILDKLKWLGMMEDALQPSVIIERAKSIPRLASSEKYKAATDRCGYLLRYLAENEEFSGQIALDLRNIPFLPILGTPNSWPLSWKASENEQGKDRQKVMFETPSNLFHPDCKELVACKHLVLDERKLNVHSNIFSNIGVKRKINITTDVVLEQLTTICASPEIHGAPREESTMDTIIREIYQYLEDKINEEQEISQNIKSTLKDKPVIYLGNKFVEASKVAFSIRYDCKPELYEVGLNRIGRFKRFLETVGVQEKIEIGSVIDIIKTKQLEYGDRKLKTHEFSLIRNLLEYLTDVMSQSGRTYDHLLSFGEDNIFAPDTDTILRPTYQLCFDDCDFVSTSSSMKFVHSDLSRTCSEKLGVFTKRRKCIEECSLEIPFEQKEDLVTRLKGLLDGYPCDVGIMKELIQNADDANATEIHFMIDFRTHRCEHIFDESYSEFQGPAICVFNDSFFSKADLSGIQNLGIGSKSTDPCKTGQYGVGFNAVYNVTDMPTFLTKGQGVEGGETLCIFDPLHRHCKRKVGTRYVDMQTFRKTFGDVMSGYNEDVFFSGRNQGTVFRLPLRKTKSDISDVVLSKEEVMTIFADFKEEMLEIFLFLKNVSKITISDITSGHLEILCSVSEFLSESHRNLRSQFNEKRKDIGNSLKSDKLCILTLEPYQAEYEIHTEDDSGRKDSWFVVQRIGFSTKNAPETIEEAVRSQKIGLLPQGGVAVPLSFQQSSKPAVNGRAYCFLPLPEHTGLPMHINGHFVLDHEARRSLWKEDKGYKSEWNKLLISDVIAPAYIDALKFVKSILFPDCEKKRQQTISMVLANKSSLEAVLPNTNEVSEKYWKHLVQSVFKRIITSGEPFFPVILEHIDDKCKPSVECRWNAFQQAGHMFSVIFTENNDNLSVDKSLQDLLKSIGMKISSTSLFVQQAIIDVGYDIRFLTPDAAIDFLRSYNRTAIDKVQLDWQLPCEIQNTKIRNVQNVKMILEYCSQSKQFEEGLNSLPLLVTNDGVLRCFETEQKVYLTEFCGMLKHSACQFVHAELVDSIYKMREKRFKQYLKGLRLADFASLLQFEVNADFSTTKDFCNWDPKSSVIPNKNWVKELWRFVAKDFALRCKLESVDVANYLEPLENWCLLPASLSEREYILMNISKANSLIFLETFKHPPALYNALLKMGIPRFREEYVAYKSSGPIAHCLVRVTTPILLLNCFSYFRGRLHEELLSKGDCHEILRYFTAHLEELQNGASFHQLRNSLRALPFFLTKKGNHVTLDTASNFVMIPDEMPLQGLDEWSQKTGTILVENSDELESLFRFLGITYADAIDFYTQYILENLVSLPDHSIGFHLEYIKDYVLQKHTHVLYSDRQNHLIQILRNLDVIPDKGTRKKASDYFSPHHPVFSAMCRSEEFPPGCFRDTKWKDFLELIGMKNIVTGQMFIQFAKEIATAGQNKIANTSKKKSRIVVQHLLKQNNITEKELKEISTIKCIVPHIVESKYSAVHKQNSDAEHFICFSQSVSCEHYELSWTSMPLLPKWADPVQYTSNPQRDLLRQFLDVYSKPPLNSIISHCQNVCDSLMDKRDGEAKRKMVRIWITAFMEKMYETLQSEALSTETAKERLSYTPVVLFPKDAEDAVLVRASQVIEELTPYQEMKPYLWKAPRHFGKYYPLFRYLGASENPSFVHYIKVLSVMKEKVGSSAANIAECGVIQKALDNMFKCLKEEPVCTLDEELSLYLPTRRKNMVSTSQITIVDNKFFESRLGTEQINKMHIFIGFEALEITGHTINSFLKLPDVIRPKCLSEIVREKVDESAIAFMSNSPLAIKLENFLRSSHFIQGVLRLCIHSKSDRNSVLTETDRDNVLLGLKNTKVRQVTGLNTYLLLNDERIDASKRMLNCFMPPPDGKNGVQHNSVYFQKRNDKTEEQWLNSIDFELSNCISQIIPFKLREKHYIMKLMHKLNDPSNISLMLDEMKINAYELPADADVSVFPDPGTYVPSELHHLLNCDFSSFEEHEYRCVALELEDESVENEDASDSYKPVYIFVQIRRKMPTNEEESEFSQTYEVFTGTDTVIVPAFKLYKFIRPDNDSSTDVVDTVTVPVSQSLEKELYTIKHTLRAAWNRPEEERRQIIKRLYLRWHPDKNIGNEKFCSKVFCYIKEVIIKLERGLLSDDEDSTDGQSYAAPSGSGNFRRRRQRQSRAYPDFSSSKYFAFCEKLNKRCGRENASAKAYYGSGFTSRAGRYYRTYFDSFPKYQAYPDPGEASRWLRQAKADLAHAVRSSDNTGNPAAFNWICYLCHQATEKSLKAAWFAKDANKVQKYSHDICGLAGGLTARLRELTQELSTLVGEHTKMRYPDVLMRPKIPSTVYSKPQAEQACKLTREIVSLVADEYSIPSV